MINRLKIKVRDLKKETYTLYLVYKDSRVSWWKRLFLGLVIGYSFCPIDLIPDFIPILGYLDDLVLVPLGVLVALRLIPEEIFLECREKAMEEKNQDIPIGRKTVVVIIFIWVIGLGIIFLWILDLLKIVLTYFTIKIFEF
ncbi:MAG: DUF1232 domain-containing protein [Candidatus Heimdallarchaeota archaeon]|nr:MAG: DUF1232 domain-containing protein [Candidatus Heimdallarchaeota archaeon]